MVAGDAATLGRMGDKAGKRGETPAGQVTRPGAPRKAQGKLSGPARLRVSAWTWKLWEVRWAALGFRLRLLGFKVRPFSGSDSRGPEGPSEPVDTGWSVGTWSCAPARALPVPTLSVSPPLQQWPEGPGRAGSWAEAGVRRPAAGPAVAHPRAAGGRDWSRGPRWDLGEEKQPEPRGQSVRHGRDAAPALKEVEVWEGSEQREASLADILEGSHSGCEGLDSRDRAEAGRLVRSLFC